MKHIKLLLPLLFLANLLSFVSCNSKPDPAEDPKPGNTPNQNKINWNVVNTSSASTLKAVYFTDNLQGWAAGHDGTILHTTDGGKAWTRQVTDSSFYLKDIFFTSNQNGWAVGSDIKEGDELIISTTNGGETWKEVVVDEVYGYFEGVYFVNATKGFIIGGTEYRSNFTKNVMLVTEDGGKTWQKHSFSNTRDAMMYDMMFTDNNSGWISASEGHIYSTVDGGETWSSQGDGSWPHLYSIYMADANHGWAAGERNTIDETADGGKTWENIEDADYYDFYTVFFTSPQTGWIAGESSINDERYIIKHTQDGGKTWTKQRTDRKEIIYDIFFKDATHGWAVGSFGSIFIYKP
ncbi:MAG: hypothetical protein EOP53_09070 [Sphingobacteriales bacterium]|nr:MAG: hypothetical protein EOP53_09070 [Sphingobacteriales bacterium]